MTKSRFVLIGLGTIGQELLRRLSRELDVVCVDVDPAAADVARSIRGDEVRVVTGDATSRLVLEDAEVEEADAVILTTSSERVSVEVARVLSEHFTVQRVVAVGITQDGIAAMDELGVEVESIFLQAANALRNRIDQRSKEVHGVGLGKGEILEVEVHPNSRLANKPLRFLPGARWRVGIVYREGNIISPRRDTVLKGRDRLIILGEPSVLRTISEILTFQFQRFPLEYGPTLTAYLTGDEDDRFFKEVGYLFSVFPLERLVLLASEKAAKRGAAPKERLPAEWEERMVSGPPLGAILEALSEAPDRRGLIVVSKRAATRAHLGAGLGGRRFLRGLSHEARCPVLLAGGTFPYQTAAVPCTPGIDVQHVFETVFEIASLLHYETCALLVRPSPYLSSEEDVVRFEERRRTVSDMALIYKTSAEVRVLEGNPVHAVLGSLDGFRLLVLDTAGWGERGGPLTLLEPDPLWSIVRRAPLSTLLVPPEEEAL